MRSRIRSAVQLAVLGAVVLTARASFADHYRVPSGSMEPTVHVGDHIVVAKAAYGLRVPLSDAWLVRFGEPARGDVVVLDPPSPRDDDGPVPAVLLKRVAALPRDVVEVRGGQLRIDGQAVAEPWASLADGGGPDFGPERVPFGKLLVLGDNRGNSHDGRQIGWIDERRVLGRALAVVARDGRLTYEPL